MLPLSVFNAEILEVIAVSLVEKLPESVFSADILDVIAVVLVEKLPLSDFNADILEVIAVNLVLTEPLSATRFTAVKLPLIKREPVKLWASSIESPNFVLPLVKTIEEDTISVWNSWAVTLPSTVKSPWNFTSSLAVILLKRTLSVLPKLWTWSKLLIKALDVVSKSVVRNEKLPLSVFKLFILEVIAAILAVAWVILNDMLPLSTFRAFILDVIAAILEVAWVILSEKLPLSVFKLFILDVIAAILAVAWVILNEKLPLSDFNAEILEVAAVALNEKLPLSVFKLFILDVIAAILAVAWVALSEKLAESFFKALILEVIAVTLVEKLPLSTLSAEILDVIAVTLVEKLPESTFNADILEVIAVTFLFKEDEKLNIFELLRLDTIKSPSTLRLLLAVIFTLALICPSEFILSLSTPPVKNLNWSLSSPALFSALILVSWSTSITPPRVPQFAPS